MKLDLLPGEVWWGGLNVDGHLMPYAPGFARSLDDLHGNMGAPLLVSNRGRYVWGEAPFACAIGSQSLALSWTSKVGISADIPTFEVHDGHHTLRGAFLAAARDQFPLTGTFPDPLFFTAPAVTRVEAPLGTLPWYRRIVE